MSKSELKYNILLIYIFFLVIVSIPTDYFIQDELYKNIINGIIRIIYAIFLIFYINKKRIINLKNNRLTKKTLLLIPFVFAIFNNIIITLIIEKHNFSFNIDFIISQVILFLGVSLIEEIVFRGVIFEYFNQNLNHKLKAIILSSLIFSLTHLLNISNFGISFTLLQITYSFLTGLLFAFIYVYTNNISLSILFHFTYNLFNETIFISLTESGWNKSMYLFTIINIILLSIYGIIIYQNRFNYKK